METHEKRKPVFFTEMSSDDLLQRALRIRESLARAKNQATSDGVPAVAFDTGTKQKEEEHSNIVNSDVSAAIESKNDARKATAPTVATRADLSMPYTEGRSSVGPNDDEGDKFDPPCNDDCGSRAGKKLVTELEEKYSFSDSNPGAIMQGQPKVNTTADATKSPGAILADSAKLSETGDEARSSSYSDHSSDDAPIENKDTTAIHSDSEHDSESDDESQYQKGFETSKIKVEETSLSASLKKESDSNANKKRILFARNTSSSSSSSSSSSDSDSSEESSSSSSGVSSKFSHIFSKSESSDVSSLGFNLDSSSESEYDSESDSDSDSDADSSSDSDSDSDSSSDSDSDSSSSIEDSSNDANVSSNIETGLDSKSDSESEEGAQISVPLTKKNLSSSASSDSESNFESPKVSKSLPTNERTSNSVSDSEDNTSISKPLSENEPIASTSSSATSIESVPGSKCDKKTIVTTTLEKNETSSAISSHGSYESKSICDNKSSISKPVPDCEPNTNIGPECDSPNSSTLSKASAINKPISVDSEICGFDEPESDPDEKHSISNHSIQHETGLNAIGRRDIEELESAFGDSSTKSNSLTRIERNHVSSSNIRCDFGSDHDSNENTTTSKVSRSKKSENGAFDSHHFDNSESDANRDDANRDNTSISSLADSHTDFAPNSIPLQETIRVEQKACVIDLPTSESSSESDSDFLRNSWKESIDKIHDEIKESSRNVENSDTIVNKARLLSHTDSDSHYSFLGYAGKDEDDGVLESMEGIKGDDDDIFCLEWKLKSHETANKDLEEQVKDYSSGNENDVTFIESTEDFSENSNNWDAFDNKKIKKDDVTSEKLFENISNERENSGSQAAANIDRKNGLIENSISASDENSITKGSDAVANGVPEAFFENPNSKNSVSNIDDSWDEKSPSSIGKVVRHDPELFFVSISEDMESHKSSTSESNSDGDPNVDPDEEQIDDPEVFFADILDASERRASKISIHSLPNIPEDEYEEDELEDLDHSYEMFLAGAPSERPFDNVHDTETHQDYAAIGQNEQQYISSYSGEETEIIFFHEEMEQIGLSPTIAVKSDEGLGISARSSLSGRWSLGADSYLEDLLTQREERENEQREEIMEEALQYFDSIIGPKTEELFLEILDKVTVEKKDEFAKRDLIQDTLILRELEFRQDPTKRKVFLANQQKAQQQNDNERYPEVDRSLFATRFIPEKAHSKPPHNAEKKEKVSKSPRYGSSTKKVSSSTMKRNRKKVEQLADRHPSTRRNDNKERRRKRRDSSSRKDRPGGQKEANKHSSGKHFSARRHSDIEHEAKKKTTLPRVIGPSYSTILEEPVRKKRSKRHSSAKRSTEVIKSGQSQDTALPRAVKQNLVPEERSSSHFTNGFEGKYLYDEERAVMDREALCLRQEDEQLSSQEFIFTKRRLLASSFMCCLAFALILVFILDPLEKRSAN